MDVVWWALVIAVAVAGRWLLATFAARSGDVDDERAAKKREKYVPKPGSKKAAPKKAAGKKGAGKKGGAGAEELAGDAAAAPAQVVKLRPGKGAALREAAEAAAREREQGADPAAEGGRFNTVVSKHTKERQRQMRNLSRSDQVGKEKARELADDARWDHDNPAPTYADKAKGKSIKGGKVFNPFAALDEKKAPQQARKVDVPQKKKERAPTVLPASMRHGAPVPFQPTEAMQREMERVRRLREGVDMLSYADVSAQVLVQGKWFPLTGPSGLLEVQNFAHAPQLLTVYLAEPDGAAQGGLFVSIGGKEWCGERCTDDLSWVAGWAPPLLKVLGGEAAEAEGSVYWGGDRPFAKDGAAGPAVRMSLSAPAVQLAHVRSPAMSPAPVRVDAAAFADAIAAAYAAVATFTERVTQCAAEKGEKLAEDPERRGDLRGFEEAWEQVRGKLPKVDKLRTARGRLVAAAAAARAAAAEAGAADET